MSAFFVSRGSQISLAALLYFSIFSAQAATPLWEAAGSLSGWEWSEPHLLDMPGATLNYQRFRAAEKPLDAARLLSRSGASGQGAPGFERLQFAGNVMLLSAWDGARHWLVQLQADGQGTSGLLSSLVAADTSSAFDPLPLLPAGSRQVLHVNSRMPGTAGLLASYDCPGSLDSLWNSLDPGLRAGGWRPAEASPALARGHFVVHGQGSQNWTHQQTGQELMVHMFRRKRSVGVTFWLRPGASS